MRLSFRNEKKLRLVFVGLQNYSPCVVNIKTMRTFYSQFNHLHHHAIHRHHRAS
ncbi:MAG: hypothetical protein H0X15_10455 [Acidobacteria bacterium]|nr:hypothetical protein [Acidobacteriota bacterium]MBA3785938.1 hypothetical protein [Acidobacteriota bacterium]